MIVRAKARLGDIDGANGLLRTHVKRLKRIAGNMAGPAFVTDFMNEHQVDMFLKECQILASKNKEGRE